MIPTSMRPFRLKAIAILVLLAFIAGCSSNNPSPLPAQTPSESPERPSLAHALPPIMGVALDPSGDAIPLAAIGEAIGDFNGVISGDLQVSPTGWVTVEALGYATSYTHIFAESADSGLFEARLTPFSAGSYLAGGGSETLYIQNDKQLSIELTIDSSQFTDPNARVMLAAIDRLDVDASYQDVDGRNDLNLHFAFALQAFDDNWREVPLRSDKQLETTLVLPIDLVGDVTLATFNPNSGTWESIPGACSLIDTATHLCSLDRLSPLFGVFHEAEVSRGEVAFNQIDSFAAADGTRALMSVMPSFNTLEGDFDTQFKIAWDLIVDWINGKEVDLWTLDPDLTEGILDDPELLDLIDNLIDVALNFAAQNRNEAGKTHLVKAAEPAHYAGHPELAAPALNEAGQIALEMGEEILKDPDCGKITEAFRIAENNSYFSVETKSTSNQKMAQDIYDAYDPLLEKCDIWTGTITVRLPTLNTHPVEDFDHRTGSSEWMEIHQVRISTNVETKVSRAEDALRLLFNIVNYSAESFECPNEITYGSSMPGDLFLAAPGYFDGEVFKDFGKLAPKPDSRLATVMQQWNFQSKYGDPPSCQPDPGGQITTKLEYVSLLSHGFVDETPAVTLQEILDSWEVGSDVIQGSREISNPEPETSNIPVATGYVMWNLIHEVKLLPIDIDR